MSELRVCSNCGYDRGFHSSYKEEDGKVKVIFICPECGSKYDIGLIEERIKEINITKLE